MKIDLTNEQVRNRVCCNCRHNIRTGDGFASCHCEIDGHYIGYVACFDDWCRHWASDEREQKDDTGRVGVRKA